MIDSSATLAKPTCTELTALLLAIRDEPFWAWYDTTRLVLADWLADCGDERHATVRQVEAMAVVLPKAPLFPSYTSGRVAITGKVRLAIYGPGDSVLLGPEVKSDRILLLPFLEMIHEPIWFALSGRGKWYARINLDWTYQSEQDIPASGNLVVTMTHDSMYLQTRLAVLSLFPEVSLPREYRPNHWQEWQSKYVLDNCIHLTPTKERPVNLRREGLWTVFTQMVPAPELLHEPEEK